MTVAQLDLNEWITRLKGASSRSELMAMLDQFRPLEWTDEQRSAIARLYMRLLDNLAVEEAPAAPKNDDKNQAPANDGPVWYEKM